MYSYVPMCYWYVARTYSYVPVCYLYVLRAAERTRGARGKILFGAPMTSSFSNKTKNQWTVLQSVENTSKRGRQCLLMQPLMPCTRPDFDEALFNFRIFLKLGAPSCLGPGASFPPCPPPPSAALYVLVCTCMLLVCTRVYWCGVLVTITILQTILYFTVRLFN